VGKIGQPVFAYEVAAAEVMSMVEGHRFDLAEKVVEKMLEAATATKDLHVAAQALGVAGEFFAAQGRHKEAHKSHWEGIEMLCRMKEICPFCLSDAFRNAGAAHMALGECVLADNRFGKALMAARAIPNRTRQIQALHYLARHWAHHGELRPAVAGYVLLARLVQEYDPTRDDASLGLLLGELEVEHGKDAIADLRRDVEGNPEAAIDEALAPHEIADFAKTLDLKRNAEGDHW
jgi:tetratricopeptide (TPR) repeat protein